jgi:uncharacterized protein YgbK (DUF1537 family)
VETIRHDGPSVSFYGDDFTGATDALAQFHRFGLRSLLLLRLPPEEKLREYAREADVVGIAGISRSLPTADMESEVRPALTALAALGPRLVQYKVCSTFDSSPFIGSIGRVVEIAASVFGLHPVAVLPAQPEFGRYTAFGNHFASFDGKPYRLDRHPTMCHHPSTPMEEADLCTVLEQQTDLPVRLIDVVQLSNSSSGVESSAATLLRTGGPGPVVIDSVDESHLIVAGELIWSSTTTGQRFAVGSGGLSYGLAYHLASGQQAVAPPVSPVRQVLAVSGSCSQQTARQISHALDHGWTGVHLDPQRLLDPDERKVALSSVSHQVLAAVSAGDSVIVYTAGGEAPRAARHDVGDSHRLVRQIGAGLGATVQQVLERTDLSRVIIAGGDTSGYAVRAMDAYGLEVEAPLVVAGTLCRLRSTMPRLDGVQVLLKGGQVGGDDLFEVIRSGSRSMAQTVLRDGDP